MVKLVQNGAKQTASIADQQLSSAALDGGLLLTSTLLVKFIPLILSLIDRLNGSSNQSLSYYLIYHLLALITEG